MGLPVALCLPDKRVDLFLFLPRKFTLFVLGLSIGSNPLIVENLWSFGWQAIVFALLTITGSLLASLMVFRLFFKKGGSDEK